MIAVKQQMDHKDADILVCGACRQTFALHEMASFVQHKQFDCDVPYIPSKSPVVIQVRILLCWICSEKFVTPWSLLSHVQTNHALQIVLHPSDSSISMESQTTFTSSYSTFAAPDVGNQPVPPVSEVAKEHRLGVGTFYGDNSPSDLRLDKNSRQVHPSAITDLTPQMGLSTAGQMSFLSQNTYSQTVQESAVISQSSPSSGNDVTSQTSPGQDVPHDDALSCEVCATMQQDRPSIIASQANSPAVADAQSEPAFNSMNALPSAPVDGLITGSSCQNQPAESAVPTAESWSLQSPSLASSQSSPASAPSSLDNVCMQTANNEISQLRVISQAQWSSEDGLAPSYSPVKEEASVQLCGYPGSSNVLEQSSGEGVASPGDAEEKLVIDDAQMRADSQSEVDAADAEPASDVDDGCCSNQDCGITIVPGSHEEPQKCCNAVIPKKRKRHMETKHPASRSARLNRFRRSKQSHFKSNQFSFKNSRMSSIYIDVESVPSSNTRPSPPEGVKTNEQWSSVSKIKVSDEQQVQKERSVVIQPGCTFSIPVNVNNLSHSSITNPKIVASVSPRPIATDNEQVEESLSPPAEPQTSTSPAAAATSSQPSIMATPAFFTNRKTSPTSDLQIVQNAFNKMELGWPSTVLKVPVCVTAASSTTTQSQAESSSLSPSSSHDGKMAASPEAATDEVNHTDAVVAASEKTKKRRYPTSRPFKCTMCDHAFNQRIHLKKHHQSKHTGDKPFKCGQCNYSTVERSHLKVHIRVHTGEKPFKCTYCEYATAQNSTLKIHLRRHHNTLQDDARHHPEASLVLKCSECGLQAQEKDFRAHTH